MPPEFPSALGVEAEDAVFAIGVPQGEDTPLRDRERGETEPDLAPPRHLGPFGRPSVQPARFRGEASSFRPAPMGPIRSRDRERKHKSGDADACRRRQYSNEPLVPKSKKHRHTDAPQTGSHRRIMTSGVGNCRRKPRCGHADGLNASLTLRHSADRRSPPAVTPPGDAPREYAGPSTTEMTPNTDR